MRHVDMQVCKIEDPRLVGYTNRTRSGTTQVFYTGDDCRDWARYQEERKTNPSVDMHNKPDTIEIEPPERHYYAELINGEWWWLNGCAECNGRERDWLTYVECDKHNACCDCQIPRDQLTETPWGGKRGWRCNPCQTKLDAQIRRNALEAFAEREYDEYDFQGTDTAMCPHCATSLSECFEDGIEECPTCGGKFKVETKTTIRFTTSLIGERITL